MNLHVERVRASFVAILAVGLASPALGWEPNDSEQPGSVLVFHKFFGGSVSTSDQGDLARTEFEISVTCPKDSSCVDHEPVRLRAHWVCPGDAESICRGADFELQTSVNGTIFFNPEGIEPTNVPFVPAPSCSKGYLIVWAIDDAGQPIKFDGLIGDAVIRRSEDSAGAYNALPIQAAGFLTTRARTDQDGDGRLDFDGGEYEAVTGKVFGNVRYETTDNSIQTSLTLLTLDVSSNQANLPTSIDLDFFNENEERIWSSVNFVCWTQPRLTDIKWDLNTSVFGRKGLVQSGVAQREGRPVSLVGIVETKEGFGRREYLYSLYNDGTPVASTFAPAAAPEPPPEPVVTRFEESAATYAGTWTAITDANAAVPLSGGAGVASVDTGSTATFTFTGTGIAWIALRCEVCGIANVFLDGALVETVDTFATTRSTGAVFSRADLPAASHTLTIEVTGSANPSSGATNVVVDAFDVTS